MLNYLQNAQPAADWGQVVIRFLDANPGIFVALVGAVIGLLGVIPFALRVEFNRRERDSQARFERLKGEVEESKDMRKLLSSLTDSIKEQNSIYRDDRREAREAFLKALNEQNNKFATAIGQIAGNQATSASALQKTSDAITEVKNQLVQMQMDALNRDQIQIETRKTLEDGNRISENGFKNVGDAIKKLETSISDLKKKWEESHAVDDEIRDSLKEIRMIVEKLPVQDGGTTL